jgi:hypothetical protein
MEQAPLDLDGVLWTPTDNGWTATIGGHVVEVAPRGGGNPPGRGGQQTNVSSVWWRFQGQDWKRAPSRGGFRKAMQNLPEFLQSLADWGLLEPPDC